MHGGDAPVADIQFGDGVVFLQGDPGAPTVFVDADVFRFQVLGHAGVGAEDAHRRVQLRAAETPEVGSAYIALAQAAEA